MFRRLPSAPVSYVLLVYTWLENAPGCVELHHQQPGVLQGGIECSGIQYKYIVVLGHRPQREVHQIQRQARQGKVHNDIIRLQKPPWNSLPTSQHRHNSLFPFFFFLTVKNEVGLPDYQEFYEVNLGIYRYASERSLRHGHAWFHQMSYDSCSPSRARISQSYPINELQEL